jgi:hypothetical protein
MYYDSVRPLLSPKCLCQSGPAQSGRTLRWIKNAITKFMKKFLLLPCLFILWYSCDSPTKSNCSSFRKGKFVSHSVDGQFTIVERNDSVQSEISNTTGHIMKATITWINDCEYELSNTREGSNAIDSLKPIWLNKVITTKIIEVRKDYCVYESTMNGVSTKITDTLYILNKKE